jgi:hypothetical protein
VTVRGIAVDSALCCREEDGKAEAMRSG